MAQLKKKNRPLDSVEAYACMCPLAVCSNCGRDNDLYNSLWWSQNYSAIKQVIFPGK